MWVRKNLSQSRGYLTSLGSCAAECCHVWLPGRSTTELQLSYTRYRVSGLPWGLGSSQRSQQSCGTYTCTASWTLFDVSKMPLLVFLPKWWVSLFLEISPSTWLALLSVPLSWAAWNAGAMQCSKCSDLYPNRSIWSRQRLPNCSSWGRRSRKFWCTTPELMGCFWRRQE